MVPQDPELEDGPKFLRKHGGVAVGLPADDEAHEAGQPILGRGPGQVLQRLGAPPRPREEPAGQPQARQITQRHPVSRAGSWAPWRALLHPDRTPFVAQQAASNKGGT